MTDGIAGPLAVCDRAGRTYMRGGLAVAAVNNVSLEVGPATRLAISGPSGSGKSTLLYLLAGLETPSSGSVSWPGLGGHPLGGAGRCAMVFQGPSLLADLDAVENIAFPLHIAGLGDSVALAQAGDALHRLGLGALRYRLPSEMSGGQAQRIAIARALASGPRLIVADEPTGALDRTTAAQVMSVLIEVADELSAGLVISTHDPSVAARMRDQRSMVHGLLEPQACGRRLDAPAS